MSDENNDEIDGSGFAGEPNVLDGDPIEPKKPSNKKLYSIIIIMLVGMAGIVGFGLYFDIENHPNVVLAKETIKSISKEPTKDQVMEKLKACTILYITIQDLIDQMEPEDDGYRLESLSEQKQEVYNDSYNAYFNMYCNLVKDEVVETEDYQHFNNTREK